MAAGGVDACDDLAARYFSIAERQLFRRHVLWTRIVGDRRTETPDGPMDLPEYVREYREGKKGWRDAGLPMERNGQIEERSASSASRA